MTSLDILLIANILLVSFAARYFINSKARCGLTLEMISANGN